MMKIVKVLFILITICNPLYAKDVFINRNLICLYNSLQKEDSFYNNIQQRLEVVLNYYGYYCDYFDANNLPENTSKYSGIVYWSSSNKLKNPIYFYKWLIKNRINKKILLLGDLPVIGGHKDFTHKINKLLKNNFGFYYGNYWSNSIDKIKIQKKADIFDFELKLTPFILGTFDNILIDRSKITPLLKLEYNDNGKELFSYPVFIANWGGFAKGNKIFYSKNNGKIQKWLINPFKFVQMIFNTDYPVPETTTINGRRILYIHLDGDGVLSKSEVIHGDICGEVWYEKIGKVYPFKTGVSFIAADIDPEYKGNKRVQKVVREIYALPNVEPASHTYTHPLDWHRGLTAYRKKGAKEQIAYYGTNEGEHIKAYLPPSGEIDHEFEILGSIKYLNKFTPKSKKVKVIYWSGDCMPTKKDLEIVKKNHLFAFNNGDTFFDLKHNSYAFVTPLGRYVNGLRQIYSSDSNENVYTELWSSNFWGFVNVIETFKNTGFPIRIKPINLYYHFYSLAKLASYRALVTIYNYLMKNKDILANIFPSEFIKIVENFYNVKIFKSNKNVFFIENAKWLKEFRFQGKVKIKKIFNVKSVHYNKKLNVTYVTLGNASTGKLAVFH